MTAPMISRYSIAPRSSESSGEWRRGDLLEPAGSGGVDVGLVVGELARGSRPSAMYTEATVTMTRMREQGDQDPAAHRGAVLVAGQRHDRDVAGRVTHRMALLE